MSVSKGESFALQESAVASKKNNKYTQNYSNTVTIQYYFTKNTLNKSFLIFLKPFTPKKCQLGTQNWIFDNKLYVQLQFYTNPENFTPSRMVWMVTFSKSDTTHATLHRQHRPLWWELFRVHTIHYSHLLMQYGVRDFLCELKNTNTDILAWSKKINHTKGPPPQC